MMRRDVRGDGQGFHEGTSRESNCEKNVCRFLFFCFLRGTLGFTVLYGIILVVFKQYFVNLNFYVYCSII